MSYHPRPPGTEGRAAHGMLLAERMPPACAVPRGAMANPAEEHDEKPPAGHQSATPNFLLILSMATQCVILSPSKV